MISVDTFQMHKRGMVIGTQVHETSSSDVVPDSTQVHQEKSSDAVSDTSSIPLFKEDTSLISSDDSTTKPNVNAEGSKLSAMMTLTLMLMLLLEAFKLKQMSLLLRPSHHPMMTLTLMLMLLLKAFKLKQISLLMRPSHHWLKTQNPNQM